MMPIGKKIPAMENEEKIGVVSEGLLSDKTAEKIWVFGRGGGVRSRPSSVKFQISIFDENKFFVLRNSSCLIESSQSGLVSFRLVSTWTIHDQQD